jgi:hypothetical protein
MSLQRAREVDNLLYQEVHIHRGQCQLHITLAVKFPHPRNRCRHIIDGALDHLKTIPAVRAHVRLRLQQRFSIERYRRQRVVDIVRNAARHLAERAQPLLLHHGLLALAQVVVSLLQFSVQLRLLGRQCNMLAQLPQKLAIPAAKAVRLLAGDGKDAEHRLLSQ